MRVDWRYVDDSRGELEEYGEQDRHPLGPTMNQASAKA